MTADEKSHPETEPTGSKPRVVPIEELLGGRNEVHILHAGQIYRLRITRQNKLILTK